ncbi:metal ABC transporter solute-binding protein, Zn/Mn family [Vacuolonema iberomarrocanum]|uniref:metal ABC transporter solute-binding protein, Zn/Mn family n=1 Tax=Vacuolonema iberomarrocanum TaxID=3454632 RepID=UPI001A003FA4|nr:zinc ABC transporter substrate-binding protein [filamentous cyanobacterium LEGE 07170]
MCVPKPNRIQPYLSGGVLAIALLLAGCDTTAEAPDSDRPDVVTTSTMITDWTARVGGDAIDLTGILEPGADPHVYEPVPRDSIALEEAELIFYNGYDLEPSLIRLINGTGVEARKVAVGEAVSPLDTDYAGERVPDPHVWGDVENAVVMVEVIQAELSALAPDQAATFDANAAAFIAELEALDQWISAQIDTIPPEQRKLVTTHDAFEYFTHAYGLESAGTLIGISTEEQPSAQTVQQLSDTIQALGVPAIFAETTINPRLVTTVAEEAGVTLAETELYSDSIGAPGSDGETYIDMMTSNTRAIVENLGGTFTAFNPE